MARRAIPVVAFHGGLMYIIFFFSCVNYVTTQNLQNMLTHCFLLAMGELRAMWNGCVAVHEQMT